MAKRKVRKLFIAVDEDGWIGHYKAKPVMNKWGQWVFRENPFQRGCSITKSDTRALVGRLPPRGYGVEIEVTVTRRF